MPLPAGARFQTSQTGKGLAADFITAKFPVNKGENQTFAWVSNNGLYRARVNSPVQDNNRKAEEKAERNPDF